MKKPTLFICFIIVSIIGIAEVPVRYYVGDLSVDEGFWKSLPDSLINGSGCFDNDSVVINWCDLRYTHFIDSISTPGEKVIKRRSAADSAAIEAAFGKKVMQSRADGLKVAVGEIAPQITVDKGINGNGIREVVAPGKCYLLSFWATWCGNCLMELQPQYIPAVAAHFKDNGEFVFLPICIDATKEDLSKFFSKPKNDRWSYLASITALDTDRSANSKFGKAGIMPLNVVIGKSGKVVYIHSGALLDTESLAGLTEAINEGLSE